MLDGCFRGDGNFADGAAPGETGGGGADEDSLEFVAADDGFGVNVSGKSREDAMVSHVVVQEDSGTKDDCKGCKGAEFYAKQGRLLCH